MCCPTHCATYCAPSQPLPRVVSGWIRSPPFCNGAFPMMQGLAVLSRSLTLGWCYQTWGDNISVLSDVIGLPADYNTDNSGHKELSRGETHVSVCPCSFMLVQHSVRLSSTKCAPLSARRIVSPCKGTSLIRPPPPQHPTVASCLGAYGDSGGGVLLISEIPLYDSELADRSKPLQGYLAHKKQRPPLEDPTGMPR